MFRSGLPQEIIMKLTTVLSCRQKKQAAGSWRNRKADGTNYCTSDIMFTVSRMLHKGDLYPRIPVMCVQSTMLIGEVDFSGAMKASSERNRSGLEYSLQMRTDLV